MSEQSDEKDTGSGGPGISDEQLPEDLQPTDDNPLAKNPGEDDDAEPSGLTAPRAGTVEGTPDMGNAG